MRRAHAGGQMLQQRCWIRSGLHGEKEVEAGGVGGGGHGGLFRSINYTVILNVRYSSVYESVWLSDDPFQWILFLFNGHQLDSRPTEAQKSVGICGQYSQFLCAWSLHVLYLGPGPFLAFLGGLYIHSVPGSHFLQLKCNGVKPFQCKMSHDNAFICYTLRWKQALWIYSVNSTKESEVLKCFYLFIYVQKKIPPGSLHRQCTSGHYVSL